MAVSITYSAQDFAGNGSIVTAYPVSFPVDAATDIWVAVKLDGETEFTTLDRTDFTVVDLGGGSFQVTTGTAYAAADTVKVFRLIDVSQPFEFPEGGSFPSRDVERAMDRLLMLLQQVRLEAGITGSAIEIPDAAVTIKGVQVVADATARGAAKPGFIGQLLVQLSPSPATVWIASSMTVGAWTQFLTGARVGRTFASLALLSAGTPAYIGELATVTSTDVIGGGSRYTLHVAYGTGVGQWNAFNVIQTPFSWQYRGWAAGEPLVAGQRRWVGNTPRNAQVFDQAFIDCDTPGAANAVVKVHLVSIGWELTSSPITLTPANVGSALLAFADWTAGAQDTQLQRSRLEVEIISTGGTAVVTAADGSTISTPGGGALATLKPGTALSSGGVNGYLVSVRGDGTVVRSHPAEFTGSETLNLGERVFVRGVVVSLAGGVTTIPASAADLALISNGDPVVGVTVPPGTKVVTKGSSDFVISNPLLGATTLVTVVSNERPPVLHFTSLSLIATTTVITLPTTDGILVGDRPYGLYVPTTAYISAINPGVSVTISSGISGGTATEITIRPPARVATVTAGNTTASLSHTVGLLVGSKVTGAGVQTDTFLTAVSSPNITVNNEFTQSLAGAATDLFEFTREEIQLTGTTANGSAVMNLPYAVNTTPAVAGMVVTGPGVQPGTLIQSVAGSDITLTKPVVSTQVAANFRFYASPAKWTGLQLTLNGSVYSNF